jgi:sugar phosphate isomerase/epimerase
MRATVLQLKNFQSRTHTRAHDVSRDSNLIDGMNLRASAQEHTMMHHIDQITRRKFFSRSAFFFSATVATRSFSRAQDSKRAIGLGFSLYGMKALSIDDALSALAEIGYDCVELPVMNDWPADSARFTPQQAARWRDLLSARRLRLTALMENLPALGDETAHHANLDRLKRAADMARQLSPTGAQRPLIETIMGGKAGEFDVIKDRLVDRLRDWVPVMAAAEVKLAVKAHIGNATQRPEQLLWLLDQVRSPWLVAAYDYSHFELQNLAMKETVDYLIGRSSFVHVKDTEHAPPNNVSAKRNFLLPGEGSTDYPRLLKLISDAGYRGDIVVEVSSQVSNKPGYEPLTAAKKCYQHLGDAFTRAGITRG